MTGGVGGVLGGRVFLLDIVQTEVEEDIATALRHADGRRDLLAGRDANRRVNVRRA